MTELVYGTEAEHLETLTRAREKGVCRVWSGDIRRNPYLRENLEFAERKGIAKFTFYEDYEGQESGWVIKWLPQKGEGEVDGGSVDMLR